MVGHIDDSIAKLRGLVNSWQNYLSDHYTEADTRVKFIDPILTQILGWHEFAQISREEKYTDAVQQEQRCIDYTCSLNEPVLVVEAKRLLKEFEIPDSPTVKYKLDGVIRNWKNAWAAIQQARAYCDEKQAKFALVTNGRQFIAFQAISERAGGWLKGNAIVWRSPEDLIERFTDFYTCFASDHIAKGRLSILAGEEPQGPTRHRPRTYLTGVIGGGGYRNNLYDVFQRHFSDAFLDLPDPTDEFLQKVYCTSDSIIKYGKQLDTLLVDDLPTFRTPIQPVKAGHKKDPFARQVTSALADRSGKLLSVPLIVVMGGAGVGKTTFLQWYFRTNIAADVKQQLVAVSCDYRTVEEELSAIRHRTHDILVEQLAALTQEQTGNYEQMKEIYRDQITAAKNGELKPWASDPVEFEKRISEMLVRLKQDNLQNLKLTTNYLRARAGKHVAFILDNIDQKDEPVQIKLFQIAQELVSTTKALVVFVMRESTYLNLMQSPQLNAFVAVDFHVKVQPAAIIIDKRLEYVEESLGPDSEELDSLSEAHVSNADVRRFLGLLRRTLTPDTGDARITQCLEAVATANTRGQLKTVYDFLVSGHTKLSDYLSADQKVIPFHEFVSSIILEDRKVFVETDSDRFINVFALNAHPNASHFTILRIVAFFRSLGHCGDCSAGEYLSLNTIAEQFAEQGLTPASIFNDLKRMAKFGLLLPESQDAEHLTEAEHFAVTRSGLYYLDTLYSEFSYVSAVMLDTMMSEVQSAQFIGSLLKTHIGRGRIPIMTRVSATERFLSYLEDREDRERASSAIANHPIFGAYVFTSAMKTDLARVKASVLRH